MNPSLKMTWSGVPPIPRNHSVNSQAVFEAWCSALTDSFGGLSHHIKTWFLKEHDWMIRFMEHLIDCSRNKIFIQIEPGQTNGINRYMQIAAASSVNNSAWKPSFIIFVRLQGQIKFIRNKGLKFCQSLTKLRVNVIIEKRISFILIPNTFFYQI